LTKSKFPICHIALNSALENYGKTGNYGENAQATKTPPFKGEGVRGMVEVGTRK